MKRGAATRGKVAKLTRGAAAIEVKATIPEKQVKNALARYGLNASSDNELVDLRTGTLDVGWDQMATLREEIVDAQRYLNSAVEFMQAVDGDDPVSALVAWAGHLRRDLRCALARRRSKEDADASPESP